MRSILARTGKVSAAARLWRLLLLCLVLSVPLASSAAPTIWIALSESGAAHTEVAEAIRRDVEKGMPSPIEWVIAPWSALADRRTDGSAMPKLVIAVGAGAWTGVVERFATRATGVAPSVTAPALLATLMPRLAYEQTLARRQHSVIASAIFLDQPFSRQAKLLRLAFPAGRRVGLILGPDSRAALAEIRSALTQEAFTIEADDCLNCSIGIRLQTAIERSDVLLATPDQQVFNSQTIAGILSAGYRRRLPLVGFSPAYVKAGAAIALYSTPEQQGIASAEVVLRYLQTGVLPAAQSSPLYSVAVNADVARAFNLALDAEALERQLRKGVR